MAIATKSVGRVSIRVVPDSTGFRDDLQKTLERIERTMRARIPVEFVVDRDELLKLKAQLEAIRATVRVGLDIDDEALDALRARIEAMDLSVDVNTDLDTAMAERRIESLTRSRDVLIRARVLELGGLDLTGSGPFSTGSGGFWDSLFRPFEQAARDPGKNPVARMFTAAFQGDFLQNLIASSFSKINDFVMGFAHKWGQRIWALGGGNVLMDMLEEGREFLANIDRNAVKIGTMFTAISALANLLIASIGSIFLVSTQLAQMLGGLALLAPSILAPLAVGIGTLVAVLKDASTVLADLKPVFADLQNSMSTAFWKQSADVIRRLVDQLLPDLRTGLTGISDSFGGMMISIAAAMSKTLGNGVLTRLFDRMKSSIDIAANGVFYLVSALVKLTDAGSKYWDLWSQLFTQGMINFDKWVDKIVANGDFDRFIARTMKQVDAVIRLFDGLFGTINAIALAAERAGLPGLVEWADSMQALAKTMQGPAFQKAMTITFIGAKEAVDGIFRGIANGGRAMAPLFDRLGEWGVTMGRVYDGILTRIGSVLGNKQFLDGVDMFIRGIDSALSRFDEPTMKNIASGLGTTFEVLGRVLDAVAVVISAYFKYLAPIFDDMMELLGSMAGPMADAIASAMKDLQPGLQSLWDNVLKPLLTWVKNEGIPQFKELAHTWGPLLADAFRAIGWVMRTFVIPALDGGMNMLGALGNFLSSVRDDVAKFVRSVQTNMAGLKKFFEDPFAALKLAAKVAWEWTKKNVIEPLAAFFTNPLGYVVGMGGKQGGGTAGGKFSPTGLIDISDNPLEAFGKQLQASWDLIKGTFQLSWDTFWGGLKANWDGFWAGFTANWNGFWAGLGLTIAAWGVTIAEQWNMFWTGLGLLVTGKWNEIVAGWNTFWAGVGATLASWGATIAEQWNSFWAGVVQWATQKWGEIQSGWNSFWADISNKASGWIGEVRAKWDEFWNGVKSFVDDAWGRITGRTNEGMGSTAGSMANTGGMTGSWSSFWNIVQSITNGAWAALQSAISGGVLQAAATVATLPGRVNLGDLSYKLVGSGVSLIAGFIRGINSMIGAAQSAAAGVVEAVRGFFPFSPAKVGPFSGRGYTTFSGKALVRDFAGGMMSNMSMVRDAAANVVGAANLGELVADSALDQNGIVVDRRTVNVTTVNPVAEPTSRTIERAASSLRMAVGG